MTRGELDTLDGVIHRRVMGLECFERDGLLCERLPFSTGLDGVPFVAQIPAYSTDMGAAWLVVERLAAAGHALVLEDWRDDVHPDGWAALFDMEDGHDTGHCTGETAALAICRAALKVIC